MSRSDPEPTCWDCGATNDPGASECWLCQRRDWRKAPLHPLPEKAEPSSGGASALVGLALGIVGIGGLVVAPGLVLSMLIFVLPAWAGAEAIAHRRRDRGLPTSIARKLVWIAVLAVVVPILLFVSVMIAGWLICQLFSNPIGNPG